MLPEINLVDLGEKTYSIEFSYLFDTDRQTLWSYFTDNALLKQWFPELSFQEQQVGKPLFFQSEEHSLSEEILAFDAPRLLSFTWAGGFIKLELTSTQEQEVLLAFQEWVPVINQHSPKDISGWLMGMQTIDTLLKSGQPLDKPTLFDSIYPEVHEQFKAIL